MSNKRVLIDADGCPVVDIAVRLCLDHCIECIILCDSSHVIQRDGIKTIYVTKGNDSVDFKLVNMLNEGDVVITQDYGLAAMCLSKKAIVINQDGMVYNDNNILQLLNNRHDTKKIRMAGGRIKGQKKRMKEQNIKFQNSFLEIIMLMSN